MRLPRVRLTIRVLMVVVAVAAVPMAFWDAWFDTPVRRWQRAIIDDQNESGRRQALMECRNGIGTIDTETALPTLVDAVRSPSFRVRETDVMGLAEVGRTERDAVPPLIEALADPEPLVRVAAARAMATVLAPGHTGRDRGVPALRRLLVDSSPLVRLQAACTLVLLGHGGDALPVLIEALREPDYHAQSAALWFLGNMRAARGACGVAGSEGSGVSTRDARRPRHGPSPPCPRGLRSPPPRRTQRRPRDAPRPRRRL